jgi:hypothetical protein
MYPNLRMKEAKTLGEHAFMVGMIANAAIGMIAGKLEPRRPRPRALVGHLEDRLKAIVEFRKINPFNQVPERMHADVRLAHRSLLEMLKKSPAFHPDWDRYSLARDYFLQNHP